MPHQTHASGTKMWCPLCKSETVCSALPPYEKGQRKHQGSIHWFERTRKCTGCHKEFVTVEIDQDLLYELLKLRDAIRSIANTAETLLRWKK